METLKAKVEELLNVSGEDLKKYFGKGQDWSGKFDNKMKRQEELIDELHKLARANKTLLGRTVRFPMADSYALYLVTKVNKTTVRLQWLDYCDGWMDDRCGNACNIGREYVEKQIRFEDFWDDERNKKAKKLKINV